MPRTRPIDAIVFDAPPGADVSSKIAPPYDVLDADSKGQLVAGDPHNIAVIDLPHLPAKALGPDHVYEQAGATFRDWLAKGVLKRTEQPASYIYRQTFSVGDLTYRRCGLLTNVAVQEFGPSPDGHGGIYPHEQTFSAAKQDRLKLMQACEAQLSSIFGLYSDPDEKVGPLLRSLIDKIGAPTMHG